MCWFAAIKTLSNINSNHQVNTFTDQNIFVSRNVNYNSSYYLSDMSYNPSVLAS